MTGSNDSVVSPESYQLVKQYGRYLECLLAVLLRPELDPVFPGAGCKPSCPPHHPAAAGQRRRVETMYNHNSAHRAGQGQARVHPSRRCDQSHLHPRHREDLCQGRPEAEEGRVAPGRCLGQGGGGLRSIPGQGFLDSRGREKSPTGSGRKTARRSLHDRDKPGQDEDAGRRPAGRGAGPRPAILEASMLEWAECEECGEEFSRDDSEWWKRLCYPCWKDKKRREESGVSFVEQRAEML
jgi:hypothetical protein